MQPNKYNEQSIRSWWKETGKVEKERNIEEVERNGGDSSAKASSFLEPLLPYFLGWSSQTTCPHTPGWWGLHAPGDGVEMEAGP